MFEGLLLPWLPSCFFIQFLEQLVKFLVNFTLLKYVKPQRSYCFFITKELIFGFQILDLKDHFSAFLRNSFLIFTPKDLTISETTESTSVASYLDLLFIRDKSNNITTKLDDKRDAFGFHIVNFPFMSSNIPSAPAYCVYTSQLIRYARCC